MVKNRDGEGYLKCSSIRFLNFLGAKHIVSEFMHDHNRGRLNRETVEYLLDFVFESDNLECLRFCGELLCHEPQRDAIIKALNARELKQDTECYYNLCLIIIMCLNEIQDDFFSLGNCFSQMYFKRNEEASYIVNINCENLQSNAGLSGNNFVHW